MKRTIFAAILDALLSAWGVCDRIFGRLVGSLSGEIFGAVDREWAREHAARARVEMWS